MKKTFNTFLTNKFSGLQKLALSVAVVMGFMMSSFSANAQNWLPVEQATAALKTQYYIQADILKTQTQGSTAYFDTEARMEMCIDGVATLGKGTLVPSVPVVLFDQGQISTQMPKYLTKRMMLAQFRAELVSWISN
ncbi:MAG: hypothetical protein ABIV51_11925 [Saprospiraceae bacterium]